jgi:hypothetical protein
MLPLFTHNDMEAEMFDRLTMFAVVALALAVGSQAKAAPLAYGTYYDEELVVESCTTLSTCRSYFSQLPSDNLFLLKKINCFITTTQPLVLVSVSISQTSGGDPFGRGVNVSFGPGVLVSGTYYYSFQTDAQILIGQGRYPYIQANMAVAGNITMSCGIVGDLVTPIQGQ